MRKGLIFRRFMRVRAQIPIIEPLKIDFYLPQGYGLKTWVFFRIERLADFCYSCGRLGHIDLSCGHSELGRTVDYDRRDLCGPWLKEAGPDTQDIQEVQIV